MKRSLLITYKDGASIVAPIFGDDVSPEDIVLILPAMGVHSKYYGLLAEAIGAEGRVACVLDLRGQGTSSVRASSNSDWGYIDHIRDLHEAIAHIKKEFPKARIFLLGHSLGGQIGCLYSSKYKGIVHGLILIACCTVYYKGWKGWRQWRMLGVLPIFMMITKLLGYFPGKKMGFGGLQARQEMGDWFRNFYKGKYELANDDFDYERALSENRIEILSISIENDHFSPKGATENLLSKFDSDSNIQRHLIPHHTGFCHFSWAKNPKAYLELIDKWIVKTKTKNGC